MSGGVDGALISAPSTCRNGSYYSMLGLCWDNGKENGNCYSRLRLSWDNGEENGNYYSTLTLNPEKNWGSQVASALLGCDSGSQVQRILTRQLHAWRVFVAQVLEKGLGFRIWGLGFREHDPVVPVFEFRRTLQQGREKKFQFNTNHNLASATLNPT